MYDPELSRAEGWTCICLEQMPYLQGYHYSHISGYTFSVCTGSILWSLRTKEMCTQLVNTLYVNISGVIFVFLLLLLIFLAVFFICLVEIILAYILTLAFIKSIGLMVLFCLQYFQQQLTQLLCSPPSCISSSFYVIKNNAELEKDDDLS